MVRGGIVGGTYGRSGKGGGLTREQVQALIQADIKSGTWTPTLTNKNALSTLEVNNGSFTRIGNVVRAGFMLSLKRATDYQTDTFTIDVPDLQGTEVVAAHLLNHSSFSTLTRTNLVIASLTANKKGLNLSFTAAAPKNNYKGSVLLTVVYSE